MVILHFFQRIMVFKRRTELTQLRHEISHIEGGITLQSLVEIRIFEIAVLYSFA